MKIYKNITINKELLDKIVKEQCQKVPGIDVNKKIEIFIDDNNKNFTININVIEGFYNIHSIALELQKFIYFYLTKQFDTKNVSIHVKIRKN